MKYIPALLCLAVAAAFLLASTAGDNTDARALAGMLIFPALFFGGLALIAAMLAWLL